MNLLAKLKGLFVKPVPMTCDNCGVEFPPHPQATVEMHLKLRGPSEDVPPAILANISRQAGLSDADAARLAAGEDVVVYKLCCQRCQLRMFLLNIREGRAV